MCRFAFCLKNAITAKIQNSCKISTFFQQSFQHFYRPKYVLSGVGVENPGNFLLKILGINYHVATTRMNQKGVLQGENPRLVGGDGGVL